MNIVSATMQMAIANAKNNKRYTSPLNAEITFRHEIADMMLCSIDDTKR